MQHIAFDAHKHYTWARVERPEGTVVREQRIAHERGALRGFLAVVILTEIGDVARFGRSEQLAAYAGTTPRVHESGGRRRYGPLRADVNRYLKWAFVEAANASCRHRGRHPQRHISRLYDRTYKRKGHQKAIGAASRHLAEAAYWVLTRQEPYREPGLSTEA